MQHKQSALAYLLSSYQHCSQGAPVMQIEADRIPMLIWDDNDLIGAFTDGALSLNVTIWSQRFSRR